MHLLDQHKPGSVCLSSWLAMQGISHDLQKYYRKAGWLTSIGRGAYRRPNETIRWEGAVYALQNHTAADLHPGGLTALTLFGSVHNLRFGEQRVDIFSPLNMKLPPWFMNYDWGARINHVKTSFLPQRLAIGRVPTGGFHNFDPDFDFEVSEPERAIFECLYLSPKYQDLVEVYEIFESLVNLRPRVIQEILEQCRSIKVKRLFVYMAKKINHNWLAYVDISRVDLGKGDRVVVPGGVYIPEHRISVPEELALR